MAGSFAKYPKIPESTGQLPKFDGGELHKLDTVEWVATEKIHGANFCFICDGADIRCAKRSGIIGAEENFFGHRAVLRRLSHRVLGLFDAVRRGHPDASRIYLYGELFGGIYDHPLTPPDPNFQPVQLAIQYCPHIEFFAFDLAVGVSEGELSFLGYDEAVGLLEKAGVNFLKPLFIGTLNDCLNYPIDFGTTIPELLGLPPLEKENRAEGIVVKPATKLELGSAQGKEWRPCFKVKHADFAEEKRPNLRFERDCRGDAGGVADSDVLKWEAFSLVTEARLTNTISKLGFREQGQPSRSRALFGMLVADVLEEVQANQPELYDGLRVDELQGLRQEVATLVRKLMSDCLKGNKNRRV